MKKRFVWLLTAATIVLLAAIPGRVHGSACYPECDSHFDCWFNPASPLCDYCTSANPILPGECVF